MSIRNIFWFCVFNLLVWCASALSYFYVGGFWLDASGVFFAFFSIVGQMTLFMAGLLVLVLPWRIIGPRAAFWAAWAWGSFFAFFFALDIFVYTQYRFHISMAMLELFFGPAGREIFVLPVSMYVMAAVGAVLLSGAVFVLARLARTITWGKKGICAAVTVLVLCMLGYNGLYAWGKFMQVPSVLAQVSYLPWAHPMSANRRLQKMGFEPKNEPYSVPKAGTLNYPLHPLACAQGKRFNILLILIDSWRADSLSSEVMPNTYRRARRALRFTGHLAGGNATEAGVFSLFYSLPHAYWNAFSGARIPPVFIRRLQEENYQLGIFASARLNSPEFNSNIFSSVPDLRLGSKGNTALERDLDLQQDFTAFIKQRDKTKPFFGFLFYDSPHGQIYPEGGDVFKPTAEEMNYLLLTKHTDPTPYMNNYKNSVYFIDGLLEQTFSLLEKEGLEKDTIVILSGDHGQEINDTRNNFWGHNSNFAKWQTHVPMLVWWPEKNGKELAYRTTHYDVVPTLMAEALACSNPSEDYAAGRSLFDSSDRPFVIISSYNKKAIRVGDKLSVIDNYGYLENYDENYQKTETGVSPRAMAEALKVFSRFYK